MFEVQVTSANIQWSSDSILSVMVHFELAHKEDKGRNGIVNGFVFLTGEEYEANQDREQLAVIVREKLKEMINE